jgi:hypothetical protein
VHAQFVVHLYERERERENMAFDPQFLRVGRDLEGWMSMQPCPRKPINAIPIFSVSIGATMSHLDSGQC